MYYVYNFISLVYHGQKYLVKFSDLEWESFRLLVTQLLNTIVLPNIQQEIQEK